MARITRRIRKCVRWVFIPPRFDKEPFYVETWYLNLDHAAHSQAAEEKLTHAKWKYEMTDAVLEALNDKSYKLLQFTSVLAGAVAAGLKFGHGESPVHWSLGLPSMLCFGVSIALALAAKVAADCPYPMRIDRAVEMEGDAALWSIKLAASLHAVTTATHKLADWKAARINASIYFLVGGVSLFPLLLFA